MRELMRNRGKSCGIDRFLYPLANSRNWSSRYPTNLRSCVVDSGATGLTVCMSSRYSSLSRFVKGNLC